MFTSLIVALTLSLAAGDKPQYLWKRLQALQLSANTIPLFYTYAVKNIERPRRILKRFATEGTRQSHKLTALARDTNGNYYKPITVFEEPFVVNVRTAKVENRPQNTFKGRYGPMSSFTMETRAYQLLRVPSEDSVLNLPLPPGFSGKPFVEIPGGFTKADYEEKLLYIFSQIKDDLSQRFTKFPGNKKLKSLLGSSTRKLKLDRPRFPLPAFIRDTVNGYRSEASYSPYVAQNATIVLLHCRNDDPTSYYSLVWHPNHPKYTATTFLSHLAVTYDAKKLFMYETSTTFGGTLARVRRSLASHNANLCTDDVSKFKVVFTYHH